MVSQLKPHRNIPANIRNPRGLDNKSLLVKLGIGVLPIPVVSEISLGLAFAEVLEYSSFKKSTRYAVGIATATIAHGMLHYFDLYAKMAQVITQ